MYTSKWISQNFVNANITSLNESELWPTLWSFSRENKLTKNKASIEVNVAGTELVRLKKCFVWN